MRCKSCGAVKLRDFRAEMAIRFLGLKHFDKPVVWISPDLVVCSNCGIAEFLMSQAELRLLPERTAPVSEMN